MRRLPPQDIEENLTGLCNLVPDLTEPLLSSVDQPLAVEVDPTVKREVGGV
jgi:capping protein beta